MKQYRDREHKTDHDIKRCKKSEYRGPQKEKDDGKSGREYDEERSLDYALRIMEALSGVDEELLEKSGASRSGRPIRRKLQGDPVRKKTQGNFTPGRFAGTWAAVLGLLAVGIAGWNGYQVMRDSSGMDNTGAGLPETVYLEEEDLAAPADIICAPESKAEVSGDMSGGVPQTPGEKAETEAGGGSESIKTGTANEGTGGKTTEDYDMENMEREKDSEKDTGNSQDALPFYKLNTIEYTEEEARKLAGIGEYLPKTLPGGYMFERAYSDSDSQRQNLTVSWIRGTDIIILTLEVTDGELAIVDVNKPETYDERLYEIPFSETVPEEYRETFRDPIFAREDLDRQIIEGRMLSFQDNGDTDVPRGNFRVLYPDKVLLSFNGRGTAEEVWEMFCSIDVSAP